MQFVGERLIDQDRNDDQSVMMTLETHKQTFYGTPYEQLVVCHIKAAPNNTHVKFTDANGKEITSTTSRREGFKNARKKTEVAAQTTGMAAGIRAMRRGVTAVKIKLQGIGPGRVAAPKGIALSGLNVVSVTDVTFASEIGPRPQKARRI